MPKLLHAVLSCFMRKKCRRKRPCVEVPDSSCWSVPRADSIGPLNYMESDLFKAVYCLYWLKFALHMLIFPRLYSCHGALPFKY